MSFVTLLTGVIAPQPKRKGRPPKYAPDEAKKRYYEKCRERMIKKQPYDKFPDMTLEECIDRLIEIKTGSKLSIERLNMIYYIIKSTQPITINMSLPV